jgi:hypothetical protein
VERAIGEESYEVEVPKNWLLISVFPAAQLEAIMRSELHTYTAMEGDDWRNWNPCTRIRKVSVAGARSRVTWRRSGEARHASREERLKGLFEGDLVIDD